MAKKRFDWRALPRDTVIEVEVADGVWDKRHLDYVVLCDMKTALGKPSKESSLFDRKQTMMVYVFPEGRSSKTTGKGEASAAFMQARFGKYDSPVMLVDNEQFEALEKSGLDVSRRTPKGLYWVAAHVLGVRPGFSGKLNKLSKPIDLTSR